MPTSAPSTPATAARTSPVRSGQKFAREVFFLGRGVLGAARLRDGRRQRGRAARRARGEALAWAQRDPHKSPTAIRMLKFAFNAVDDGMVGQQVFAGEATRLAYGTDEAVEGRDSFLEKRDPTGRPTRGSTDGPPPRPPISDSAGREARA